MKNVPYFVQSVNSCSHAFKRSGLLNLNQMVHIFNVENGYKTYNYDLDRSRVNKQDLLITRLHNFTDCTRSTSPNTFSI